MKYFLILISLFLALSCFAIEQNGKAQELFDSGNYLGAAEVYQKQIDDGENNAYIYYNLGNSYFKAGDLDKALINYYRAFRISPRDKDIINNLSFTMEKTGQSLIPDNMPKSVFMIYNYFSLKELKGLAFIGLWLFAISITFFVFFKYRRFWFKTVIFFMCLTLFFTCFYLIRAKKDLQDLAVVIAPRAELRSGPSDNFPVALNVPRAQLLEIHDKKDDWIEVSVGNENNLNWVQQKYIEFI
ncbi:MAG: tetratricopeptide repeat protein [Elusimicrobiaceae bacterium]|nr:tetratricopeptide repeat protein [Elusimicrobiaceae bacterium]